ncbi:hypothetical protein [Bacillus sp. FJAT-27445]|uniref:hypothetical protein n=1 Tax=Bacillus sp. FJAT-27445 TaxID=1679166 RepID=UPI0007440BD5|nr:hypothetical protein [Bacillus sp. FJAT-27445]
MKYHLAAALFFWSVGLLQSPLQEEWKVSSIIAGLVAFFLFIKEVMESSRSRFLMLATEAEQKRLEELSSFKGRCVGKKEGPPLFQADFEYIVFSNGEYDIPLFCRNGDIAKRAIQSQQEIKVYYQDYILVAIENVD